MVTRTNQIEFGDGIAGIKGQLMACELSGFRVIGTTRTTRGGQGECIAPALSGPGDIIIDGKGILI